MRAKRMLIFTGLVVAILGATLASAAAKPTGNGRPQDGLYAEQDNPNLSYSNGAVDLQVGGGGSKLVFPSGVACYTGKTPPTGVPADDEVSIHLPKPLPIKGDGSFSFSGPVTISAEDAQAESPISTTYTIKGRFTKAKHGSYKAVGTDSSPVCQPSTEKHFTLEFVPGD